MYRTDKQFMKNPATASQRIYIGSLPKTAVAKDLEDKFGAHGKILGLAMQSGFAFIQFETEQQAQSAIRGEHNSMLSGKRIIVKQALDKSRGPHQQQQQQHQQQNKNMMGMQHNKAKAFQAPPPQKGPAFLGPGPPPKISEPIANETTETVECEEMQTTETNEETTETQDEPAELVFEPPPPSNFVPNRFGGPHNNNNNNKQEQVNKFGGPNRFGGPNKQDGPNSFGGQNKQDSNIMFGGQNKLEGGPNKFGGPNKLDGSNKFGGLNKQEGLNKFGGLNKQDGPNKFGGLNKQQEGPNKFGGPINRQDSMGEEERYDDLPPRFDEQRFEEGPGPRFDRGRGRNNNNNKRRRGGGRKDDRFQPPPPPMDAFRNDRDPYFNREEQFQSPYKLPPPTERPERNDCEIIVVSKALTEYAEYIEQRLTSLGLIVDLLFPNEDVPIGRVLANISSRGCLYAILVMPQNEELRSLTLNVLHGIPQEHRNMPLEDALILITRNFEAYMHGEPAGPEGTSGLAMNLADRHPVAMQMLLNLLAENRQISSNQYEKLIKYLQERCELQVQYEISEGVENTSEGSNSKQTELQNRIMNILNKSNDNPAEPPPIAAPEQSTVTPTPLLKDPSVQKALDSLLLGDMFKAAVGSS